MANYISATIERPSVTSLRLPSESCKNNRQNLNPKIRDFEGRQERGAVKIMLFIPGRHIGFHISATRC